MTTAAHSETGTTEQPAAEPLAVFEGVWLRRYVALSRDVVTAVTLLGKLIADPATSRAVFRGDRAARSEVIRAFMALARLQQRFVADLEPAPQRLRDRAELFRRAFVEIDAAAGIYLSATESVIDLDDIALVNRYVEVAAQLLVASMSVDPARQAPAEAKPRRARKTRPTND